MDAYIKKHPGYGAITIPKGVYAGQKEDALVVAYLNCLITHKDQPEDLIYNITKAIYENVDLLAKGYKTLKLLSAEMAVEGTERTAPFHPGALRYFKEKGVIK
jgi:TRAP transporter TAXI family solute receptor